jgi:hypothetical protein
MKADGCAFECVKCGAEPEFTRRVSWGFNMADAYCPTPGCQRWSVPREVGTCHAEPTEGH